MTVQTPTVIIGLGGIGSEIVERIERMTQNKKHPSKRYVRDNIEFVIIDTDENDIRQRRKQGYNGHCVSLSGNVTVGKCLEWDKDARENWYPDSEIFNLKSLSEGAGQVRAISRLAFQRAIRTGRLQSLHEAIERLHLQTTSSTNQNLKIIIVSTLAGGTGSGCVLPLALYLKNYIRNKYSSSEAKINACLLMPDILDSEKNSSISYAEKENLFANGYSAIKELSYFMHKSDNEIQGDDIYIDLPEDESNKLVRHEKLPFDFCFLFGKYTSEIRSIGTPEAYKRAITRCLYTQLVGAFSSIYFSREDNMTVTNIKKIYTFNKKEEITQSHYASASCFAVYYPYHKIKEYLSLCWANERMEEGWMRFDKEASRLEVEYRKSRRRKKGAKSNIDFFLEAVETFARKNDGEAKELRNRKSQAGQYLNHLFNYIKSRVEEKLTYWQQVKDAVQCMRENPRDWTEENVSALMNFHVAIDKSVMEVQTDLVNAVLYEICQIHDKSDSLKPYYIEYNFYNLEEKEYETPNTIRYFLCHLANEITDAYAGKGILAENARTAMNNVREKLSSVEMMDKANKCVGKWSFGKKENRDEILGEYDSLLEKSFETVTEEISLSCLEKIKSYICQLIDAYEHFFYEYKDISTYCRRRIYGLEKVLCKSVQGVDMLVCTEKECLEGMFEKMQSEPEYYRTGGEISEWIYEYCSEKKEQVYHVHDFLQEDEIIEKWMYMFEDKFRSFFDVNLFQAFTEEARYKKVSIDKNKYIIEALERSEKELSSPLLTLCRMDGREGKAYCIYSPKLENDMEYNEVVKRFFETDEAVSDEYEIDVDDKKIVFYQNRYGLEAFDVDFLAHKKGVKRSFAQGAGYKSYLNVLERRTGKTEVAKLTPHIDKTWHRRNRMPDIGFEIEAEYFQKAVQTLLICVVKEKIIYCNKKMSYQTKTEQSICDMIDYFIIYIIEAQGIVEEAQKEIKETAQPKDWYCQLLESSVIEGSIVNMLKDFYDELKAEKDERDENERTADEETEKMLQAIGEVYFWLKKKNLAGKINPFEIMEKEWEKRIDGNGNGNMVKERLKVYQKQWEEN